MFVQMLLPIIAYINDDKVSLKEKQSTEKKNEKKNGKCILREHRAKFPGRVHYKHRENTTMTLLGYLV